MLGLRSHLASAALIVALLALIVALAGTAGALPGRDRVDSGDIKDRTLKVRDFARNATKLLKTTRVVTRTTSAFIPVGSNASLGKPCNGGEVALSGGARVHGGGGLGPQPTFDDGTMMSSYPTVDGQPADDGEAPTGWAVFVANPLDKEIALEVFVLCTRP